MPLEATNIDVPSKAPAGGGATGEITIENTSRRVLTDVVGVDLVADGDRSRIAQLSLSLQPGETAVRPIDFQIPNGVSSIRIVSGAISESITVTSGTGGGGDIQIVGCSVPGEVQEGDSIQVSVTVENLTDSAQTLDVDVIVGRRTVDVQKTVDVGEQEVMTNIDTTVLGLFGGSSYAVSISAAGQTVECGAVTITQADTGPPRASEEDISLSVSVPDEVMFRKSFSGSVAARNTSDVAVRAIIEVRGSRVGVVKRFELDTRPGGSATEQFSVESGGRPEDTEEFCATVEDVIIL